MGNSVSWVAQCLYPKDQVFWAAVHYNDVDAIRSATLRLTPETRRYLEWQEPETGRTALLEAAAKGYCECARMLIKAGANCNVKDLRMNTPLHFACKRAQSELVQLLLEVPTMIPFEVNLYMKTPLDIARKRFSTEEVEDEAQAYAKCIDLLEKSFYLYSGWLYEKTDNVLSYISRVSSLHSWTRRWCVVLERGDPDVLELAFFNKDSDGVRSVCPTSVMLYNVAAGSEVTNDSSWLSRKKFAFILRGDHLSQSHYRGPTGLQKCIHFAAIDAVNLDTWMNFFTFQQDQLSGSEFSNIHPYGWKRSLFHRSSNAN
ncbi:putative pleckstrin domain, PH-like domain superfamily, ankyrin repeat-containing [Plasmopara halstedii]